jgi:hypothetical protein
MNRSFATPGEARVLRASLGGSIENWFVAFCAVGLITIAFLSVTPELEHWFVIPVFFLGVIWGEDLIRLARGSRSIFDPGALITVVGFHMFFLAPLLHVYWDQWMAYVIPPDDWRPWLGRMALLNLAGVVCYRGMKRLIGRRKNRQGSTAWKIVPGRFYLWLTAFLTVSLLAQVLVFMSFGGIQGYISEFERGSERFAGMGLVFVVSESFPILAMIGFIYWASRRQKTVNWPVLFAVILMFFVLRFLFGGLRGSRGASIWAMFWVLGLIHLWVRPISKKMLLQFAIAGFLFMYLYGFYKAAGIDSVESLFSPSQVQDLEQESGRTVRLLILGDLSRSDVQAMLAYQLRTDDNPFQYTYTKGETYLAAISLLAPFADLGEAATSKVDAGTLALHAGTRQAVPESRVYGIAGEAALNFGLWSMPVAYGVLGVFSAVGSRWQSRLRAGDSRLLIAPLVSVIVFYPLVWDLDNVLILATQFGFMPVALVWLSSRRRTPLADRTPVAT